jgi:adenylate cyclase
MANSTSSWTEHPVTVLLIDDQLMIGEAVRRMLEPEKEIIFHYCSDPCVAIPKAIEVAPTVILQDLVMPDIDGLLLLRFFRAHPATKDVPMIVLSSKEEPKIKAEAFALGANDYLVKLPDKVELIARIRYHSKGYISLLQRNEAYQAIQQYSQKLENSNELIRRVFGRYLSDEIVANLLETPEGLKLGGERRKITILTSDLRGFTSFSERLSPEEVIKILNFYLGYMADVITQYQGTIDEFMGDGILVLFGAPTAREDDGVRAVACAVAMQLAMVPVNEQMKEWGLPELQMGIGINTGEVVVGNIGSEKRTKYGVVGSQINLTYRIESYTTGGQILISESTLKEAGSLVKIDGQKQVTPKGVTQPIIIYEVGGIGGEYNLFLSKTEEIFFPVVETIKTQYRILDGKDVSDNIFQGNLVKLSANGAEIRTIPDCGHCPSALSNIKLNLFISDEETASEDVYGKVLEKETELGNFYVRFTSTPPDVAAKLETLYKKF